MGGIDPGSGIPPEDAEGMEQPPQTDADAPEHEDDAPRRRTEQVESDPAAQADLPGHEQDAQRAQETGGQPTNP